MRKPTIAQLQSEIESLKAEIGRLKALASSLKAKNQKMEKIINGISYE